MGSEMCIRDRPISAACRVALREGEAPKGRSGYLGITPVSITDEDMASRAVAHVLGLVEECEGAREARAPVAKCAHAMLEAAAQMLRATEAASAKSTAAAGRNALRLQLLHGALGWMRGWIWMHPRARQPGLTTGSLDERRAAPWRTAATTAYGQLEATYLGSEIRPVTAEALRNALWPRCRFPAQSSQISRNHFQHNRRKFPGNFREIRYLS